MAATADRILDAAQRLVQTRGYNGFSYADISRELRIRKASIHYHFPSKDDLGRRLMRRYRESFGGRLEEIDRAVRGAPGKLSRYAGLFLNVLESDGRMCLCGMLAADFTTLARPLRDEVRRFFDENIEWLSRVLAEGRRGRTLRFEGTPEKAAGVLLSSLEGAMMLARIYGDPPRFQCAADLLLAGFAAKG